MIVHFYVLFIETIFIYLNKNGAIEWEFNLCHLALQCKCWYYSLNCYFFCVSKLAFVFERVYVVFIISQERELTGNRSMKNSPCLSSKWSNTGACRFWVRKWAVGRVRRADGVELGRTGSQLRSLRRQCIPALALHRARTCSGSRTVSSFDHCGQSPCCRCWEDGVTKWVGRILSHQQDGRSGSVRVDVPESEVCSFTLQLPPGTNSRPAVWLGQVTSQPQLPYSQWWLERPYLVSLLSCLSTIKCLVYCLASGK